jgi:deazaflavin-dependent oxidoreductase (nitroreductase family)
MRCGRCSTSGDGAITGILRGMSDHDAWTQQIIDTFRGNNGAVPQFGRDLVLLHHIGARTGVARISPVMSFRTSDDGWLIVASKGGTPENPSWFHNLKAHPDIQIEAADDGLVDVHASELAPDERATAWARITAAAPGFAEYEKRTSRVIPVLKLSRR